MSDPKAESFAALVTKDPLKEVVHAGVAYPGLVEDAQASLRLCGRRNSRGFGPLRYPSMPRHGAQWG